MGTTASKTGAARRHPGPGNVSSTSTLPASTPPATDLGFTPEEVDGVMAVFEEAGASAEGIPREAFQRALFDMGIENSFICQRIFSVLDRDKDGYIAVPEFIRGLDTFVHGTEEELMEFSWQVYDADGDGKVTAEDLLKVSSSSSTSELMKESILRTFEELDSNADGFIDYTDFCRGCRSKKLSLAAFSVPQN